MMSNPSANALTRWFVVFFSFCLSFLLMMTFAPLLGFNQVAKQWDFLAMWAGVLLLLALPMLYLELALAKRSKSTALNALMSLTRDADAKPTWRIIGWLGTGFFSFLAGAVLSQLPANLASLGVQVNATVALVGGLVVAVALSCVPRLALYGLLAVGVVVSIVMGNAGQEQLAWQWTNSSAQEWAIAVLLVFLATGFGMNVYWQSSVQDVQQLEQDASLTSRVLPLWLALLGAGVLYAFMPVHFAVALVVVAGVLIQFARQQYQERKLNVAMVWGLPIIAILPWCVPSLQNALVYLLIVWGLVLCLVYSIFAGWVMKASHLRKALNFKQEWVYNVWRVAVRLVIPLHIIISLIIFVQQWVV